MHSQLIAELEVLFYKLSLFVLNHRIAQIQDQTTSLPLDIKDYLTTHLTERVLKQKELDDVFGLPVDKHVNQVVSQSHKRAKELPSLIKGLFTHLDNTNVRTELNKSLANKLKKTTEDNIHEAVRFSRLSNKEYTCLHLEIANSAIKEAAHYMSKENFVVFKTDMTMLMKKIISD
jgi:hypothetical protein